tara:strand:+ start:74 stop:412 length:339 start_codon:yes stop_codon:yes gene_type:complete
MSVKLLEKLSPLFSTHGGREKMVRIIQYALMFLIPTLNQMKKGKAVQHAITDGRSSSSSIKTEELTVRLGYIKANMSLTRKVMRFGVPLNLLLGIVKRFRQNQKGEVKMIFF